MAEVKTITEQIYSNIYELIISGKFPAGARLTMKTLQEELGVSSSPIREALTRLQQDGLVEYQPNSGVRVRVYTPRDVVSLFTLMADLDSLALKYALNSNNINELIEQLKENAQESRLALLGNQIEEWRRLTDYYHALVIQFINNPFLQDSLERIYRHINVFSIRYEADDSVRRRIQDEHEEVIVLMEQNKKEDAITLYREHVLSSMNEALKSL
ncbi:MAG: GntR family transcriptional regulator [Firmicutes bacterium]|nr:GntR family transcriptional regulator [Bacillota bacterium]